MGEKADLTFGEELRRERLIREVSLDEISAATKISIRLLTALEASDVQKLPAPVFTRGFIRAYSRHLGLDPVEVLVLPRLVALVITLPLLTFFADVMSLFGGAVGGLLLIDLTFPQFLQQLGTAVTPTMFWVGMVKAPVFAFVIAMVGCFEGLRVTGSAESVGRLTTKSVVESIFFVVALDALFSVIFLLAGV